MALILFLLLLNVSATQASGAKGKLIPADRIFSAEVGAPTSARFCARELWAYSAKDKTLVQLDPLTGETKQSLPKERLGLDSPVTALGCRKGALIAATAKGAAEVPSGRAIPLPGTGIVRDFACETERCWLLRDELYVTNDMSAWSLETLPSSKDVPREHQVSPEENPFTGWQDSFFSSKGRYFRIATLARDTLAILDPLRASMVIRTGGKLHKWGEWGVWEGRLMSPKGLAQAAPGVLAISDVGLKEVFLFSVSGEFMGALGTTRAAARFEYPLDLSSQPGILYVADYRGDRVVGFRLPRNLGPESAPLEVEQEIARMNLFHHPDTLESRSETRCLSCHDGLLAHHLEKLAEARVSHPFHVETKEGKKPPKELPLEEGRWVGCATCHQPHHWSPEPKPKSKPTKAWLRLPERELCVGCHDERTNRERNHIDLAREKGPKPVRVDTCGQCHAPHGSNQKLLRETVPALCLGCHGENQRPKSHPFGNVKDEKLDCLACHSPHGADRSASLAREKGTCLSCHAKNIEGNGQNRHLEKVRPRNPIRWPQAEVACVQCHSPHHARKNHTASCAECHNDRRQDHGQSILISETRRAAGITLDGDMVSCRTCHTVHGKPRDEAHLIRFCASCHGEQSTALLRDYHKRPKKKGAAR